MTGPVIVSATAPANAALMATLIASRPVNVDFNARVIATIAAVIVTCPTCGHATGCDCDCCRYPLPAGTGLKAGAR